MIVYGTCLAQSGAKPLYNPLIPSSPFNLAKAVGKSVGKVPVLAVYIVTLTASNGHKNKSAITSAEADERAKPRVLYLKALSGPTALAKISLKSS